jgi:hypothetical protein
MGDRLNRLRFLWSFILRGVIIRRGEATYLFENRSVVLLLGNLLVLLKLLRCLIEELTSGLGCLTALTKVCVILL